MTDVRCLGIDDEAHDVKRLVVTGRRPYLLSEGTAVHRLPGEGQGDRA